MATWQELEIYPQGSRTIQKLKCPKCSSDRKNKTDKPLSINLTDGVFNCHNCGWSGHVSGKTTQQEREEWRHEQKQQAKEWKKPYVVPLPLSDNVIKWFTTRAIERETLEYFKVTESKERMPERGNQPAGVRTCINFNYYRDSQLVNVKFRDSLKCFKMSTGAELILYNMDALKDRTEMLICEGEIDCMTFYQSGYYGATSVPNGASKGSAKLEYLDNCWSVFEKMDKIIIATDGDQAGQGLRDELARRLGSHRCWFVTYPDGCKDANEVWLKHGKDAVRKLWLNAIAPPIEDVLMVEDCQDKIEEVYKNGWPKIEPIGYRYFDRLLNFAPGEVTTITGIPQHGKDEFIRQILIRKAVRYGEKSFVFNHEEPAWIQSIKAFQQFVGKAFYRSNRDDMMKPAQKDYAFKFFNQHLFFVDIRTADLTIDGLLKKAAEMVLRKDVKYIVIGPYNCLENSRQQWQTEGEHVSMVYQKMTNFALRYNVHIFFVAHTTKMSKDSKTGNFDVPNLYNISGSANFFNKTHNGLTIYRNYAENTTDVHVQKVKFFFNGELGMQTFVFDVGVGRFAEQGTAFESDYDYLMKQQQNQHLFTNDQTSQAREEAKPNPAPAATSNEWKEPLPRGSVPF